LGYPVIATNITPYKTKKPPITLLTNDPEKWIEAISRLYKKEKTNGKNLHKWVISNYIIEKTISKWNNLFMKNK
jgi:glycosyltransferase involved in cell wall biosynthesis